jgi:hypothetical protein
MKGTKTCIEKRKTNKSQNKLQKNKTFQKKGVGVEEEKKDKKAEERKKDRAEEDKFRFNLIKMQYVLHLMKRDGNCLFSSISDQVYGTDKHNDIIRQKCMDYIEKNKLFYSQFIEGGETQMMAYIQRKRKRGIWADNLEIQALSEIYNRPIEIYININKPIRSFCNDGFDKKRYPIKISYHGNKHYNSIVPSVKHKDYSLYKKELLTTEPGIYETKFINGYDISLKYSVKLDQSINEPIQYEDFLEKDADENTEKNINEKQIKSDDNNKKDDSEYLNDPIIQSALEFGFDLKDAIEALKVCGNNKELVINYLCNDQQ